MRLHKAIGNMKPGFIHNPKHFYSNSFKRDTDDKGRPIVTGRARKGQAKNFKVVAILKPNPPSLLKSSKKPFWK